MLSPGKLIIVVLATVISLILLLVWIYNSLFLNNVSISNVILQAGATLIGVVSTYFIGQHFGDIEFKKRAMDRYRNLYVLHHDIEASTRDFLQIESSSVTDRVCRTKYTVAHSP